MADPLFASASGGVLRVALPVPIDSLFDYLPPSDGPAGHPEHPRLIPKTIHTPGEADFEVVRQWRVIVAGTPDTAREFLDQYTTETNCNYFVSSFQWGNLSHEEASRSMELFINEVMPHFV